MRTGRVPFGCERPLHRFIFLESILTSCAAREYTRKREITMKLDKQTPAKPQQKQFPTNNGPRHRFYQRRSWEKNFSMTEKRRSMMPHNKIEGPKGRLQRLLQQYQHEVAHRQHHQTAYLLSQNAQELVEKSHAAPNRPVRSPLRVIWLQQTLQQLPKALGLRTRFTDAGMQVNLHLLDLENGVPLEGELILLECFGMFEQEMMKVLLKLRFFSKAPLIILTDNSTLDWSLRALHTGADAIFTVNMPDDVIIARSRALLRRWVSL